MSDIASTATEKRCGFAAVIGAPNAGKSTLINALVGGKVSIVSPKVQTTRTVVRGITIHENTQVIFADTPGIFAPQKRLERAMVAAAWNSEREADIVLLVVDVSRRNPVRDTKNIIMQIKDNLDGRPCALVLNKIDEIKKEALFPLAAQLNELLPFDATFMISALKNNRTEDILKWTAQKLPQSEWLFEEDMISDMPSRLLAAEITREKLFRRLHEELPYALTVETEQWENFDNGSIRISQIIFVARETHKAIVLGKGGSQIKMIGEQSRTELEEILGTRIHLSLFVKVDERWYDDPERYIPWGLDASA